MAFVSAVRTISNNQKRLIYPLLIYLAILFDYQLITPHVNMGIGDLKPSLDAKKESYNVTCRTPLAEGEGFISPLCGE